MPQDEQNTNQINIQNQQTQPIENDSIELPEIPDSPNIVLPEEQKQEAPEGVLGPVPKSIIEKIDQSQNILVALSSDPTVDEMAAALGLAIFLDRIEKRATAIYSGNTPNALEFLKPEETFEGSADVLQDFVIALSKEKADHLRYKLDGDFVKIYITPYKKKIEEGNLDFSYGDYNVDLVLALDIANGADLDTALREHGRIMHDATIINITTSKAGKFGEIEWSDQHASSVSEMAAALLYGMEDKGKIEKEDATALLTGIVAATNRFSNARTTSETMRVASRLMESGANQQLVSKNITPDLDNELFMLNKNKDNAGENTMDNIVTAEQQAPIEDATNLEIEHEQEAPTIEAPTMEMPSVEAPVVEPAPTINPEPAPMMETQEQTQSLMDDLKAAEANLAAAGNEIVPEPKEAPSQINAEPTGITITPPNPVIEPTPIISADPSVNPAAQNTPMAIEPTPDIESVPEINYAPVNPENPFMETAPADPFAQAQQAAAQEPIMPVAPAPQIPQPGQADDPSAFKIPGF